jgi:DNA-binding NarL/FixJ family response regulator
MIKVAIAEDHKDVRENLVKILSIIGDFKITHEASNGVELVKLLEKDNLPEVILMDIEMPEMDGIECTKRVKELYPEVVIIILTAFNQKDKVFHALKNGANGYLLKGEKPKIIMDAIHQAKEGRLPMTPEIALQTIEFFKDFDSKSKTRKDYGLTKRESEILEQLCLGLSYKQIAAKCYISTKTVNSHIENIYRKLNVHTAIEANNIASKNKWF